jgi:hypothetical protein
MSRGTTSSPQTLSPLFRTLFFEAKGTADITAAKQGQAGFIYGRQDPRGSIWTWVVCEFLKNEKDTRKNWQQMFEITANKSNQEFRTRFPSGYTIQGVLQREMNPYNWSLPESSGTPDEGEPGPAPRVIFGVRAANIHSNDGVEITEIISGSAGEAANLYRGDVIIEINGKPIRNEDDYVDAVKNSPKTMTIKVRSVSGQILTGVAHLR